MDVCTMFHLTTTAAAAAAAGFWLQAKCRSHTGEYYQIQQMLLGSALWLALLELLELIRESVCCSVSHLMQPSPCQGLRLSSGLFALGTSLTIGCEH